MSFSINLPSISLFELFAGGGTLGKALLEGISHSGCLIQDVNGCELHPKYLQHWNEVNPEGNTFCGDICAFHPSELSAPSRANFKILAAGIPCTGASKSGRSKNKIKRAEDHKTAGILLLPTLHHIRAHKPDIVVLENVPEYAKSLSGGIIRDNLRQLGYQIDEHIVNAYSQFKTPTARKRWMLIASRIGKFTWEFQDEEFQGSLEKFLDPEKPEDEMFSDHQIASHKKYIDRKISEGCGFRQVILERTAPKAPTFVRTYHKIHCAGPFVKGKKNYRQFRPREIARLSCIPDSFPLPESKSTAIEILGQGVCYNPFHDLGRSLGEFLEKVLQGNCKPIQKISNPKLKTQELCLV